MAGREWLRSYCNLGREMLGLPFAVDIDGKSWDCATNGHAILLLEGATFQKREAAVPAERLIHAGKRESTRFGVAQIGQLLDFCFSSFAACKLCRGTGEIPDDQLGEVACVRCDGHGHKKYQPGSVLGITCDMGLLGRLLLPFRTSALVALVRVGGEREALELRDPDDKWRIYLMPMRLANDEPTKIPSAPVTPQEGQ